jgi:hypothetical protein
MSLVLLIPSLLALELRAMTFIVVLLLRGDGVIGSESRTDPARWFVLRGVNSFTLAGESPSLDGEEAESSETGDACLLIAAIVGSPARRR